MSFYGRRSQDNKWFSGIGVLTQLSLATNIFLVSTSSPKILLKATHTVLIPPLWCLHRSKVCAVPACHSWVCHLQKTAQTCGAALIFPYKSIPSPLNHLACSSLNLLQFVYILPGPGLSKSEHTVQMLWVLLTDSLHRPENSAQGSGSEQSQKWPVSSFQRGHFFLFQSSPFVIFSVWLSGCRLRKFVVTLHIPESHIAGDVRLYR